MDGRPPRWLPTDAAELAAAQKARLSMANKLEHEKAAAERAREAAERAAAVAAGL